MNWEGCARKWSWPILWYYPRIFLKGLWKSEGCDRSGRGLFYGTILEFASRDCGKVKGVREVVVAYVIVLSQNLPQGTVEKGRLWKKWLWPILYHYPRACPKELSKMMWRKWSWLNLKYYPRICIEGLRKTTTRTWVRLVSVPGWDSNQPLQRTCSASPSLSANTFFYVAFKCHEISSTATNSRAPWIRERLERLSNCTHPLFNDPSCPPWNSIGR
jgi:hypothetical protein